MLVTHVTLAALGLQITEAQGTLLTIFVGIIAICVLGITLGLVASLIFVLRAKEQLTSRIHKEMSKAKPLIASARAKVEPIIANTGAIIEDLKPKLHSISEDVAELTQMVRAQATDLDSTLSDVTSKARSQVDRVNGMVSSTLDTTNEVVSNIERGIRVPFRELSGILAGVKAGFDVLTSKSAPRSDVSTGVPNHITRDIERAARQAQSDASQRAREGRAAEMRHTTDGDQRSVVEAGEELNLTSSPLPRR